MHPNSAENAAYGLTTSNLGFQGRAYVTSGYETGVQSTTSIGVAGGGQAMNNVQPTIMMQKIIKALNA
jgi:microcystin-dependent protein